MLISASIVALTSCILFFSSPAMGNDLKIVTRSSSNGRTSPAWTEYISGSRSRTESGAGMDNIAGHRVVSIVHRGDMTDRNFLVDLDAHEYTTYETDKRGIALGAKSYPVEYTGGHLDIWIESTDTGERQEIFGHTARHIITKDRRVPGPGACSKGSEAEYDGWYIDYSVLPEWRRPKRGEVVIAGLFSGECRDKIEIHRSGVELGVPIKVTSTRHSQHRLPDGSKESVNYTSLMETIEFSEAPLDPALFEVPADFRQVKELTSMNQATPPTAWERFKKWASHVFH